MTLRYILLIILVLSCQNKSNSNDLWEEAQNYYSSKEYDSCVRNLQIIISSNDRSENLIKSKYLLSEIFLNEYNRYDISIDFLKDIIKNHSNHELAKKSLFTLAYVYGNYLDAYTDAYDNYVLFLSKYPEDELVPSIKYELENLQPFLDTINEIINR